MRKTRILFEGHDLKFLTHVMNHYKVNHHYHVDVFTYEGHVIKDTREVLRLLPEIDIIFCEWGLGNLQWFSHNKLPGQKLVTRIHLQEFITPYLGDTNWENVDKAIVVGPAMKERFDQRFPGVSDKCQVISNLIDTHAFDLEKTEDARFNLGLLGILPMRKAPHLAVEILQELHKTDKRYKLFIKGRRPEEVDWLWKRPEEQEYYNRFYASIQSYGLQDHVVEEAQGSDVPEWFRHIGFVISPSEFESFHMAIAEGMASRAIPIIRNWKGSEALFPTRYSFSNIQEAVALILKYTAEDQFVAEGQVNREYCIKHFDLNVILPEYDKILLADFHPAAVRHAYAVMAENHRQLLADLEKEKKNHEKISGDLSLAIQQHKVLTESNANLVKEISVFSTELTKGFSTVNTELAKVYSGLNSGVTRQTEEILQHANFLRQHEQTLELRFNTFIQQYEMLQKQLEELSGIKDQYTSQIDAMNQHIYMLNQQIAENRQLEERYNELVNQFEAFRVIHQEKLEVLKEVREEHALMVDKLARSESALVFARQEIVRIREELSRENQRIRREAEEEKLSIRNRLTAEKNAMENLYTRENKQARAFLEAEIARMERDNVNLRKEHSQELMRKDEERRRLQLLFNQLKDTNADLERRLLLAFNSVTWKVGAILVKKPMDFFRWIGRKLSRTK